MDSVYRRAFGRNLKHFREAREWSQHDLAKRTGVAQTAISYLERSQTKAPTLDTIEAIAKAFGVPAWAMLLGIDSIPVEHIRMLEQVVSCYMRCHDDSREQIARVAEREAEYTRARRTA
jgi:transcriptional regulator with XRE-family HTH domain